MDKLRLDLETLEVERLDIVVAGLSGGLETFGMGHASTELGQSCQGANCDASAPCDNGTCMCSVEQGASCAEGDCVDEDI